MGTELAAMRWRVGGEAVRAELAAMRRRVGGAAVGGGAATTLTAAGRRARPDDRRWSTPQADRDPAGRSFHANCTAFGGAVFIVAGQGVGPDAGAPSAVQLS